MVLPAGPAASGHADGFAGVAQRILHDGAVFFLTENNANGMIFVLQPDLRIQRGEVANKRI
jgi:hypothetical protein